MAKAPPSSDRTSRGEASAPRPPRWIVARVDEEMVRAVRAAGRAALAAAAAQAPGTVGVTVVVHRQRGPVLSANTMLVSYDNATPADLRVLSDQAASDVRLYAQALRAGTTVAEPLGALSRRARVPTNG